MTDSLVSANATSLKNRFLHTRPGLPHYGHNSFENALIQALFACEEFRVYVLLISEQNPDLLKLKYLSEYFKRMATGTDEVIIIGQPVYPNEEIDPSIYMSVLLDSLCAEYEESDHRFGDDFPDNQLGLVRESECECKSRVNRTVNWITPLRVSVWNETTGEVSVQQLAELYFQTLPVKRVVRGLCRRCGSNIKSFASKPIILILELVWLADWTLDVSFEENIRIQGHMYTLVAFICWELRNTVDQYFCCYSKIGSEWYRFNDESVRVVHKLPIQPKQLETAYLLFYQIQTNIEYSLQTQVNALIPQITVRPKYPYSGTTEPIVHQRVPPPPSDEIQPQEVELDLIGGSIGPMEGLFNRDEGICYFNTALQALFHCEAFRLRILCGGHSGRFHKQLRQYFVAINDYFEEEYDEDVYNEQLIAASNQLYESFCWDEHKEFATFSGADSYYFIVTLIFELNDEFKYTSGFGRQKLPIYKQKPANCEFAWRQLMVRQYNSYLFKLFAIQKVVIFSCVFGHKLNDYTFSHWIAEHLHLPEGLVYPNRVSLQSIVDSWYVHEVSGSYCAECGQQMYWKSKITRANNCLMFTLQNLRIPNMKDNYITMIDIDESIYVCSQYYYCKAIVVHTGPVHDSHCFVFVRVDNEWTCFDDRTVETVPNTYNRMLPRNRYTGPGNRFVEIVFYEKVSPANRQLTASEQDLVQTLRPQRIQILDQ